MNRFFTQIGPAVLVTLSLAASASAEEAKPVDGPRAGDAVHGGRTYRLECAACHGVAGWGDGPLASSLNPAPAPLRNGGVLWSHTDDDFIALVTNGTGLPQGAPAHGFGLTAMDARDILVWLKGAIPEPGAFFSEASQYIAHKQTIDQYGLERVEKVLGAPLGDAEKSMVIYTMFKPADGANASPGHAVKIPEDPSALYDAKPKNKLGFVVYLPLELEAGTVHVAMAMNANMRLTDVRTLPADDEKLEKLRLRLEPILKAFAGSGGRTNKQAVETHHGPKAPKDVQKAMTKAYEQFLEGTAMYEKEEKERFWAEPDALKVTPVDDVPAEIEAAAPQVEQAEVHVGHKSKKKHK